MGDGGQFAGPVGLARSRDPRFAYAQALANSALDSSTPIRSNMQGIGQLAKAAVSGLAMNRLESEYKDRDSEYARTVANMLDAQQGKPAETRNYTDAESGTPTTINWEPQKPDPQRAIMIAAGNRDTAPLAISMAQQEQQFQRGRAAAREDRVAGQDFTREMAGVQHNYQVASMELSQAFQAAQTDKSIAAQERLAKAAQAHSSAEAELQRTFTLNSAGPRAEAEAGGTLRAQNTLVPNPLAGQPGQPAMVPAAAAVPIAKDAATGQPTADQAKSGGYADRMVAANALIDKFGNVGTDWIQTGRGAIPVVGNQTASPEYQQLVQAKRDFVNAKLRQESGAAISQSEFDNADKQYFPQPGDKPETLKNKAELRARVIYGMQQEAGNKYKPMGNAGSAAPAAPSNVIRYDAQGNRVP